MQPGLFATPGFQQAGGSRLALLLQRDQLPSTPPFAPAQAGGDYLAQLVSVPQLQLGIQSLGSMPLMAGEPSPSSASMSTTTSSVLPLGLQLLYQAASRRSNFHRSGIGEYHHDGAVPRSSSANSSFLDSLLSEDQIQAGAAAVEAFEQEERLRRLADGMVATATAVPPSPIPPGSVLSSNSLASVISSSASFGSRGAGPSPLDAAGGLFHHEPAAAPNGNQQQHSGGSSQSHIGNNHVEPGARRFVTTVSIRSKRLWRRATDGSGSGLDSPQ